MYNNPYKGTKKENWRKSNFHVHAGTGWKTCGMYDLEEVVKLYKECGHEILCISNHDIFTDTKELRKKYEINMINGFEYSMDTHMLLVGCNNLITGSHQQAIDECNKQGGFSVLNHPNWQKKEYWPVEKMLSLKGFTGIEVFNGVIERLEGTSLAEDVWDALLSAKRLIWGFGNDDFHRWYDLNNSYTYVNTDSFSKENIVKAIKEGKIYVSTGLVLEEFSLENNVISIKAKEKECYEKEYTYYFIGEGGNVLKETKDIDATYSLAGEEKYVRVKVLGEQGFMLLTQPVYKVEEYKI